MGIEFTGGTFSTRKGRGFDKNMGMWHGISTKLLIIL